jgi:regulator of cell morphogenesis and NO signaling
MHNALASMNRFLKPESFISEIVVSDYRTADVFKRFGINYCCSGQVSLEQACKTRGLDYAIVEEELFKATLNISISNNTLFSEWKVEFLIDYIINIHHAYLYQALPSLQLRLESFVEGHKKKYPELIHIAEVLAELSKFLLHHNHYEEEIIFPYIKQIDAAYRRKESYGNLFVRTLRKPLSNIEREHEVINEHLRKLQLYTNNYLPPANACTNHQVIYHKLHEVYSDLIQHKHLERNILFPRAIEIEQQLLQL